MFFRDPVAPFANIGRALRPAGRLMMMVLQAHEQNEWSLAIEEALGGFTDAPASEAPDPFSLADPAKVAGILYAAGFTDVTFTDVHRRIHYGRDVAAALEWVRGFYVHDGGAWAFGHRIGGAGARAPPKDARSEREQGRRLVRLARLDRKGASSLNGMLGTTRRPHVWPNR
jgi:hypothetical protein